MTPQLILLRHGESVWNKMNVFTGWVDVPLSEKGVAEAQNAGDRLSGLDFDVIFTSTLVRALETAMLVMTRNRSGRTPVVFHSADEGQQEAWSRIYSDTTEKNVVPVYRCWHLNERYYGELQGKNKKETADAYGDEQVLQWRRSYDVRPPRGESLKDTAERTIPFFQDIIYPWLEKGKTVLVSAHGNSLRSIVMHLDGLSREQVLSLEIPTGVPLLYGFSGGVFSRKE